MKNTLIAFALSISSISLLAGTEIPCLGLSNKSPLCRPLHMQNATQIAIYGSADRLTIEKRLGKYGFKPVLLKSGRALMSVNVMRYGDTEIGGYSEFVILYPIQTADSNIVVGSVAEFIYRVASEKNDPKRPHFANFTEELILDGNKKTVATAIDIGVRGYGIPKEPGYIEVESDKFYSTWFLVENKEKSLSAQAHFETLIYGDIGMLPMNVDLYRVSTGLGRPVWSHVQGKGKTSLPMPVSEDDFQLTGKGRFGELVRQLNFKPSLWLNVNQLNFSFGPVD